ncbi:MAG: cellulose biosynthesis protein BcsS [Pseudomonadales bacterium]|nr:cellulose biosynthesis protein BcsS [Pseudomonadales bacterium]
MKNYKRVGFTCMLLCAGGSALAADDTRGLGTGAGVEAPEPGWKVPYIGIDAGQSTYFAYSGVVWALNKNMGTPGVLFNVFVGNGQFKYASDAYASGLAAGSIFMANALVGYRTFGQTYSLTGFIGVDSTNVTLPPVDRASENQGRKTGIRATLDYETNNYNKPYLAVSLSYSSALDSYSVRLRPGYRVDAYAFGPEVSFHGSNLGDYQHLGLFSNYSQSAGKWGIFSVSASGGWAFSDQGDGNFVGGIRNGPYGDMTLSLFY